jgi:hypothetical protein
MSTRSASKDHQGKDATPESALYQEIVKDVRNVRETGETKERRYLETDSSMQKFAKFAHNMLAVYLRAHPNVRIHSTSSATEMTIFHAKIMKALLLAVEKEDKLSDDPGTLKWVAKNVGYNLYRYKGDTDSERLFADSFIEGTLRYWVNLICNDYDTLYHHKDKTEEAWIQEITTTLSAAEAAAVNALWNSVADTDLFNPYGFEKISVDAGASPPLLIEQKERETKEQEGQSPDDEKDPSSKDDNGSDTEVEEVPHSGSKSEKEHKNLPLSFTEAQNVFQSKSVDAQKKKVSRLSRPPSSASNVPSSSSSHSSGSSIFPPISTSPSPSSSIVRLSVPNWLHELHNDRWERDGVEIHYKYTKDITSVGCHAYYLFLTRFKALVTVDENLSSSDIQKMLDVFRTKFEQSPKEKIQTLFFKAPSKFTSESPRETVDQFYSLMNSTIFDYIRNTQLDDKTSRVLRGIYQKDLMNIWEYFLDILGFEPVFGYEGLKDPYVRKFPKEIMEIAYDSTLTRERASNKLMQTLADLELMPHSRYNDFVHSKIDKSNAAKALTLFEALAIGWIVPTSSRYAFRFARLRLPSSLKS